MCIRQLQLQASDHDQKKPQCKGRKGLGGDVSYSVTAPEMCPWNYVLNVFSLLSIQLPLSSPRLTFCLLPSDLLTIDAGDCP